MRLRLRLIIDSVADGKRAAVGIDEFLRGVRYPEPVVEVEIHKGYSMTPNLLDLVRQPVAALPLDRRTGSIEVEMGFDEEAAQLEAQRCLHCWVNTIFEGSLEDGSLCVLCGGCVDVCPENCLELVALDRFQFEPGVVQQLVDREDLLNIELEDVRVTNWGSSRAP